MAITKAHKEFMQNVVSNIVTVPDGADPIDFAESMWQRMCERGYGDTVKTNTTAKTGKPRVSMDWEGKLHKDYPIAFEYFNQLIAAWKTNIGKNSLGKNNAAKAYYALIQKENPNADQQKHIVYAAGDYARKRKDLNHTPMMLQGYLNQRYYGDMKSVSENQSDAMRDALDEEIRTLLGDQARYQIELNKSPDDKVLIEIMKGIKIKLKKARKVKNG